MTALTKTPTASLATVSGSSFAGSLTPRGILRRRTGTPDQLRVLAVLACALVLGIGVLCAQAVLTSRSAITTAVHNTEQLVRIQTIHVELLRADTIATGQFLVGGQASSATNASYQAALSRVDQGITAASAAQPADSNALAALAIQVHNYANLVQQAKDNNLQGFPVGAVYLESASSVLRSSALPIVNALTQANQQRADSAFSRADTARMVLFSVLAVVALVAIGVVLAKRTHRVVNFAVTLGCLLMVATVVLTFLLVASWSGQVGDVRDSDYATAVALTGARTAAGDARANENLTLVAHGSGAAFAAAAVRDQAKVVAGLNKGGQAGMASDPASSWTRYQQAYRAERAQDQGGNWTGAVRTATSATGGTTVPFVAFDADLTRHISTATGSAENRLDATGAHSALVALVIAAITLIAATLVAYGFGQRIGDYR